MLRNSTVGTKLMAVILPPLLVVVAITAYGVRDRLEAAHRAEDASFAVSMLWAGRQLTNELQVERMWSALLLEGMPVSNQLDEQQTVTDRSWNMYLTLAGQVSDDVVYKPMVDRAVAGLRDLQSVRASIKDGSRDLYGAFDWYGNAINQVISVGTGAVGAVPDAQGSLDLNTYISYALTQEAYAKRAVANLAAQGHGSFDPAGRLWRLDRSANNRAFQLEQLLYSSANPAQTEAYNELLNTEEVQLGLLIQNGIFELIRPTVNQGDGTLIGDPVELHPEVVASVGPVGTPDQITPTDFLGIIQTQLATLDDFGKALLTEVDDSVHISHDNAKTTAMTFVVGAFVGLIISAFLAWLLTRRLTRPIRKLNKDAKALVSTQIPAVLEQMVSPEGLAEETELELLATGRRDELGQLAKSFDQLQNAVLEVAEDHSLLLHKGISDLFVNIARRNQSLIDRQIEFIDELENQEKDPELLDSLYKLDHLATQIRRNDESLLVLAGVETGLRRARPVELHDVIRMAMGEIEQYRRIRLVNVEPVLILGNAASNLAHILAELMENATTYSPPESSVEVEGALEDDDTYTITLTDHGIGITQDQINQLNDMLSEPPLVGLSLSRNLGLAITARLARRLGVQVALTSTETGGVRAVMNLPKSILPAPDPFADQALPPRAFRPQFTTAERHEPISEPPSIDEQPASTPMETASLDTKTFTEAGLVRRVPLAERKAQAEKLNTLMEAPPALPKTQPAVASTKPKSQRSPEEVREMLSRYRAGLRKGQTVANTDSATSEVKED